jgi:tetratricopeptide (TPR) repeat protein
MELNKQAKIDELFNSAIIRLDIQVFTEEEYKKMIKNVDAVILVLNKDSQDAIEIQQLARLTVLKAELFNRIKDYSVALKYFRLALDLISKSDEDFFLAKLKSLYGLAWTTARLGDYKNGLILSNDLITYAIKVKKLFGSYFIVRGACHRELGNLEKSNRDFKIGNNPALIQMIEQKGDEDIF